MTKLNTDVITSDLFTVNRRHLFNIVVHYNRETLISSDCPHEIYTCKFMVSPKYCRTTDTQIYNLVLSWSDSLTRQLTRSKNVIFLDILDQLTKLLNNKGK